MAAQQTGKISAENTKPIQGQTEASAAANGQHPDMEGDTPASKESAPQQAVQEVSLAPDAEGPDQADGSTPGSTALPVPEAELARNAQPQQATEKDVHMQLEEPQQSIAGGGAAAAADPEEPSSSTELGRLTQDLEDNHMGFKDRSAIGAEPAEACSNEQRSTSAEEQGSKNAEVNEATEFSPQVAASRVDVDSGVAETTEGATPAAAASSASAEGGKKLQASAV